VSITDRDRKILLALLPLLFVGAVWFLLLAPQRQEAASLNDKLVTQQQLRDVAVMEAERLATTKADFGREYAELVKLGKAIPSTVDMPSLIVQLDEAAEGTGIGFDKISAGPRVAAAAPAVDASSAGQPTDAGGTPAQSGPGQAVESANDASATADAANAGRDISTTASITPGAPVPGLDTVPLEMEFSGRFFGLADFFHRMKRFVKVSNSRINVHGRLLTIDSLTFKRPDDVPGFQLTATIKATIYLSPTGIEATVPDGAQPPSATGTASSDVTSTPPLAAVAR
jgi:hypothetical protein